MRICFTANSTEDDLRNVYYLRYGRLVLVNYLVLFYALGITVTVALVWRADPGPFRNALIAFVLLAYPPLAGVVMRRQHFHKAAARARRLTPGFGGPARVVIDDEGYHETNAKTSYDYAWDQIDRRYAEDHAYIVLFLTGPDATPGATVVVAKRYLTGSEVQELKDFLAARSQA